MYTMYTIHRWLDLLMPQHTCTNIPFFQTQGSGEYKILTLLHKGYCTGVLVDFRNFPCTFRVLSWYFPSTIPILPSPLSIIHYPIIFLELSLHLNCTFPVLSGDFPSIITFAFLIHWQYFPSSWMKKPIYDKHWISWPMRIVAPI